MRTNIEEVEGVLHLVKELGGEEVDFRHVIPFEGLDTCELSLFDHKELANRQLDKARALASELGLKVVYCPDNFTLEPVAAQDSGQANPDETEGLAAGSAASETNLSEVCDMPWTMTVIHPDGGVVPCTFWFTHELLGNINEHSFEEIWNGPKYQELRRQLLTNELGPNCKHCPVMGRGQVDREESYEARKV